MKGFFGAGLARRIYFSFLAAAVLPTAVAGLLGVWVSFDEVRKATVTGLQQQLAARGAGLRSFFGTIASELQFLAGQPRALALLSRSDLPAAQRDAVAAEIEEAYARMVRAHPYLYQLRLLDAAGLERVRVDRRGEAVLAVAPVELQDKSDRYYVRDALAQPSGKVYVSPLDLNIERGEVERPVRPVLRLATVVAERGGRPLGLVIANVHAEVLIQPLQDMVQGREGTAYLFDASGQFLSREKGGGSGLAMQPVANSNVPPAILAKVGGRIPGTTSHDGLLWVHAPMQFLLDQAAAAQWSIAVALPERQLLLQVVDMAKLYGILLAALIAAAVAGYGISRRLIQPIHDLAQEADAIAAGDFARRVHISGRDEIALLGERFNLMAARLQATLSQLERHRHQLEAEVMDRTRELTAERALLASVLRRTSDAIAALRPDGTLLFANHAAEQLMDEAGGRQGSSRGEGVIRALAGSGQTGREEVVVADRTFSVSRDRLVPGEASVPVVIVARDVTEERRLVDEKRELDRQLFQMDKLATIGELAMGVAHEIGNPLAGMKAVVQSLLLEGAHGPEVVDDLRRLEAEIDRLGRFLARFRGLATPPQLQLSPQSLPEAVDDMLFWVKRQAGTSTVEIVTEIPEDLPPLRADAAQLREVLLNLFVNALHAMRDGGRLAVRAFAAGAEAVLEVRDTGRGIPPELQSKVFEPFFTTRAEGSGLGLAVCSQVVADHGGRIELHSRPGDTTFRVFWPLARETRAAGETIA
jgi:C4-dicarboxylate-specific signal transduction histidine kinase